jgi:hypothetical protein
VAVGRVRAPALVRHQAARSRRVKDPAQHTMKTTVDNRSVTASPRGGVGSNVVGMQSTATKVNMIRRARRTSLRVTGEVWHGTAQVAPSIATGPVRGEPVAGVNVVGGSRLQRERAREDGRPAGTELRPKRGPAGVRAAIVVKKRGNARGAKGGRKANGGRK